MITSSLALQMPLLTVQRKVVLPGKILFTCVPNNVLSTIVAVVTVSSVQIPVPCAGLFPERVTEFVHNVVLSNPAFAVTALFVIDTLLAELQLTFVPLVIVQVKVLIPIGMPVTPVELLAGNVIVLPKPPPLHIPVSPADTALAFNVPIPLHTSGVDVVGVDVLGLLLVTITSSVVEQVPLFTVQVKAYVPPVKPVTLVTADVEFVIVTVKPPF